MEFVETLEMRKKFDDVTLARLRSARPDGALAALGLVVRRDLAYVPSKDPSSCRVHVSDERGGVFELIVTGTKWFDQVAGAGGGGAIDVTMHVLRLDFVAAVRRLIAAGV